MEYNPDEKEQAVLDVLREHGRANPMLIRDETGLRKEYVSRALDGLQKAGVVEKVTRGLYDHVPENDDEYSHDRATVGAAAVQRAVDGLEAALEAGDERRVEAALDRLDDLANGGGE
jgi:DNA-binding Lrp family transcriptional regulator